MAEKSTGRRLAGQRRSHVCVQKTRAPADENPSQQIQYREFTFRPKTYTEAKTQRPLLELVRAPHITLKPENELLISWITGREIDKRLQPLFFETPCCICAGAMLPTSGSLKDCKLQDLQEPFLGDRVSWPILVPRILHLSWYCAYCSFYWVFSCLIFLYFTLFQFLKIMCNVLGLFSCLWI